MRIRSYTWLVLLWGMMIVLAAGCSASRDAESNQASSASYSKPAYGGIGESGAGAPSINADQAFAEEPSFGKSVDDSGAIHADAGTVGTEAMAAGLNRKLIYNANVTMEVQNFRETEDGIRNSVSKAGGYILEFSEQNYGNKLGGTIVLKVPSSGFMSFLDQLEQLKHLSIERSVKAEDVTERYIDLESRLHAKEVVEARLLDFMEKADTSEALLQFSKELAAVQQEIEQLKGQLRYLDQHVAFSTIRLSITENEPPALTLNSGKLNLFERMKAAMLETSNNTIAFFQGLLVLIAGSLPILLILMVIGAPLYWLLRKNRGGKKDNIDPPSTPN